MCLRVSVAVISFLMLFLIFCLCWLLPCSLDVINFMLHFCRGLYKYLVSPGKKIASEVHYSLTESTGNMRAWYLVFCTLSLADLGHLWKFLFAENWSYCSEVFIQRFHPLLTLQTEINFFQAFSYPFVTLASIWAFTYDNMNSRVCVLIPCSHENLQDWN